MGRKERSGLFRSSWLSSEVWLRFRCLLKFPGVVKWPLSPGEPPQALALSSLISRVQLHAEPHPRKPFLMQQLGVWGLGGCYLLRQEAGDQGSGPPATHWIFAFLLQPTVSSAEGAGVG